MTFKWKLSLKIALRVTSDLIYLYYITFHPLHSNIHYNETQKATHQNTNSILKITFYVNTRLLSHWILYFHFYLLLMNIFKWNHNIDLMVYGSVAEDLVNKMVIQWIKIVIICSKLKIGVQICVKILFDFYWQWGAHDSLCRMLCLT